MYGLQNLEQATRRKKFPWSTVFKILCGILVVFLCIFTFYYVTSNTSYQQDRISFTQLEAELRSYYEPIREKIDEDIKNQAQYSSQVEHFQRQLFESSLSTPSSSSFINSFYTPTPIFVPSVSALLNNDGTVCVPLEINSVIDSLQVKKQQMGKKNGNKVFVSSTSNEDSKIIENNDKNNNNNIDNTNNNNNPTKFSSDLHTNSKTTTSTTSPSTTPPSTTTPINNKNSILTVFSQTSNQDTRICVSCNEYELNTILPICQKHAVVSPVRCSTTYNSFWTVPKFRFTPNYLYNNNNNNINTQYTQQHSIMQSLDIDKDTAQQHQSNDDIFWIPCENAWVDGNLQFWTLYGTALVLIIFSGLFVRSRFDIAQQQVLNKLNTTPY